MLEVINIDNNNKNYDIELNEINKLKNIIDDYEIKLHDYDNIKENNNILHKNLEEQLNKNILLSNNVVDLTNIINN